MPPTALHMAPYCISRLRGRSQHARCSSSLLLIEETCTRDGDDHVIGVCCVSMGSCGPSTTWASTVTSWRSVSALPATSWWRPALQCPNTPCASAMLMRACQHFTVTWFGGGAVCDDRHPSVLLDVLEHCQLSHHQSSPAPVTAHNRLPCMVWTVLMCLVPLMMLLMTHQSHLHQPWRLNRCDPFTIIIGLARTVCSSQPGVCAPCSIWWWPPFHQDVKIHTILDLCDSPRGKVINYQWDYIIISGARDILWYVRCTVSSWCSHNAN